MIDKKKLHFFRLTLIFGIIVLFTLMSEWSKPQLLETNSSMMNDTMGNMMTSMHLGDVSINDLLYQEESQEAPTGVRSSHHSTEDSELNRIHYFTTLSIVILLPFIVAGTIFLSIVWLK